MDVGGGGAHIALNIAKALANRKFVVQDLELNAEPANASIQQYGLEHRVKFQTQDFFETQLTNLEPAAYLLSRVLHDWPDGDCVRIIKTLLPAMQKHGTKLFIAERVLSDEVGQASTYKEWLSRAADILMFTLYGSKRRSFKE